MQTKTLLKCGTSLLMAGSLASCGGGGSDSTPTPTPTPTPPAAASFQSKFGAAFAGIFDAGTTTDPVNPSDASVPALAPASDPLNDT